MAHHEKTPCSRMQLAVLFTDSGAGAVPHADVLDKTLTHFAQHHREKVGTQRCDVIFGTSGSMIPGTVSCSRESHMARPQLQHLVANYCCCGAAGGWTEYGTSVR